MASKCDTTIIRANKLFHFALDNNSKARNAEIT